MQSRAQVEAMLDRLHEQRERRAHNLDLVEDLLSELNKLVQDEQDQLFDKEKAICKEMGEPP